MSDRKLINRLDAVLIFVILLVSAAFLCVRHFSSGKLEAQIVSSGETVYNIELSSVVEPYEITLNGGNVIIAVETDCIYFKSSDCPDKLCVNSGKLTEPGDAAVCVPEKIAISVSGEKISDSPDIISY